MLKGFRDYIRTYNMIEPGDEVVAGISGGADSVCMLLNLLELKDEYEFTVKVVHINHKIRTDAANDALFVKELCDRYGLEYHLFEEDVEKMAKNEGISTEEAGRKIRYERFRQVMTSSNAKIIVAHNRNDVAETVLFNIFRGTGLEGLASIVPVNGDIIRPLLGVSREEIEAYLSEKGQIYRTDSTNDTTDYSRNKIRNVILPYVIENISPKTIEHISGLSDRMFHVREYIRKETDKAYAEVVSEKEDGVIINTVSFDQLDEMLKHEVILLAFEKLTPHRKDITSNHVEAVLGIANKNGEKRISLPYDLEAVKQYEHLIIRKRRTDDIINEQFEITGDSCIELTDHRIVETRIFDRSDDILIEQKTYTKWFDYDKIINCVKIRTRLQGDYLTINSDMGRKSLKDYLIDNKIPKEERNSIFVVADGSHIMWVIGLRISEYYKVTDKTRKILEISVKER